MKVNVPNDDNPLFFFNLFVIDQLLRNLVTRSDYLRRSSWSRRRKSVLNTWNDVTITKMKQSLGLVWNMGLLPYQHTSFSPQDWLYKNKLFRSLMTRDRFTSIMWFVNIKEEPVNKDDCLRKIRCPINHLNNIVPEMFTPHKELLLDESIDVFTWEVGFPSIHQKKKKKKEISLGSNFWNCVPMMALYWKQKSIQVKNFKTHSPLGKQELRFFL